MLSLLTAYIQKKSAVWKMALNYLTDSIHDDRCNHTDDLSVLPDRNIHHCCKYPVYDTYDSASGGKH